LFQLFFSQEQLDIILLDEAEVAHTTAPLAAAANLLGEHYALQE